MFASKILAVVVAFGAGILANPVPSADLNVEPAAIVKRAEGVHLVNCVTYSVVVVSPLS